LVMWCVYWIVLLLHRLLSWVYVCLALCGDFIKNRIWTMVLLSFKCWFSLRVLGLYMWNMSVVFMSPSPLWCVLCHSCFLLCHTYGFSTAYVWRSLKLLLLLLLQWRYSPYRVLASSIRCLQNSLSLALVFQTA
jgi:hypothetical protein